MNESKIRKLDSELIESSKKIKVLSALAWPADSENKFLEAWRKKNPVLPAIALHRPVLSRQIAALDSIASACDLSEPVEKFIGESAWSYATAGRMLESVASPEFTNYSIQLYGRPDRKYKSQDMTPVDAARYFLEVTDNLLGHASMPPTQLDITAEDFAIWLTNQVNEFFTDDLVTVVLDPDMASKALAGARRIRVRNSAIFSALDKDQLLFHEAFVHTATQLNGKKQPNLKSLGLGAPRTTRTQEGIAVLSEIITGAIDITRLRRVALRVIAVKMALDGADFIDLFRFFLEAGQPELEAVRSAQRIFRGGAVKGGVVFTKDAVYLQGLLEVHTFLRVAIRENKPQLVSSLFSGRLTLADAIRFEPLIESGWIKKPRYMPPWAADIRRVAAMLAVSAFISKIKLDEVKLEYALQFEEELKAG